MDQFVQDALAVVDVKAGEVADNKLGELVRYLQVLVEVAQRIALEYQLRKGLVEALQERHPATVIFEGVEVVPVYAKVECQYAHVKDL